MVNIIPCNPSNITAGYCNTVIGSANTIIPGGIQYSDYGYEPYKWSVGIFMAVFGLAFLLHLALGVWKRTWWVLGTLAIGTAVEILGWGGRLWSVTSWYWDENLGGLWEDNHNSFIVQIVGLVIAPTFFSAANYILLGRLINATSLRFCSLTPRSFAYLFITFDFICLVVQGVGGGIAGTANTEQGSNNGAYIMSAGVIIQLVVTIAFIFLLVEFAYRYKSSTEAMRQYHPLPNWRFLARPTSSPSATVDSSSGAGMPLQNPKEVRSGANSVEEGYVLSSASSSGISRRSVWTVVGLLSITTLLIFVRSIYRSIELLRGWSGPIATNQGLFLGMDALLMALLVWLYLVFHPGFYIPRPARK